VAGSIFLGASGVADCAKYSWAVRVAIKRNANTDRFMLPPGVDPTTGEKSRTACIIYSKILSRKISSILRMRETFFGHTGVFACLQNYPNKLFFTRAKSSSTPAAVIHRDPSESVRKWSLVSTCGDKTFVLSIGVSASKVSCLSSAAQCAGSAPEREILIEMSECYFLVQ
jgi:hypothetical protein